MKIVNEEQAKINLALMRLGIDSNNEDTRVAILSASAAFHNYIQFGVETKSIYGSELIHDNPLIAEKSVSEEKPLSEEQRIDDLCAKAIEVAKEKGSIDFEMNKSDRNKCKEIINQTLTHITGGIHNNITPFITWDKVFKKYENSGLVS